MEFRKATENDIEEILLLVKSAVKNMEENGIHQWDEIYPAKEDFIQDLKGGNLFLGLKGGEIAVVFVLNKYQDAEYFSAKWSYTGENFKVIHRLCVSAKFQNQGIAKETLRHIEAVLKLRGTESIRLDVFTENPYALRLYQNFGYKTTGSAVWRKGKFLLMEKRI